MELLTGVTQGFKNAPESIKVFSETDFRHQFAFTARYHGAEVSFQRLDGMRVVEITGRSCDGYS